MRAPAARLLVAVGALAGLAQAQTFQRVLGTAADERGYWVDLTTSGGYAVCGYSSLGTWFATLDAGGQLLMERVVTQGVARRVLANPSSFYLVGETNNDGFDYGAWFAYLDSAGNVVQSGDYHGNIAAGLSGGTALARSSSGFALAGRRQMPPTILQAQTLLLLDTAGNELGTRYYQDTRFGTNSFGKFNDIESLTGGGGFRCVGFTSTQSLSGTRETLVVALALNGSVLWAKTYDTPLHHDEAQGLDIAANGDLIVCGFNKLTGEGGGSFVMRLDPAGALLWYRTFHLFGCSNSIEERANGEIAVPGYMNGQPAILNLSSAGALLWGRNYGTGTADDGQALMPTPDGGLVLVGSTTVGSAGLYDVFLVKTDATGSSGCDETFISPTVGTATPPVVDIPLLMTADLGSNPVPSLTSAAGTLVHVNCKAGFQTSFCFGDALSAGHSTACPCGNTGASGNGCAHSFSAAGANLASSGSTVPDTLVLAGSGMPSSSFGLYMQHDAPGDQVFHDGVLCAGGTLIRLRGRNAIAGASTCPNSADTFTLSQRGLVVPGSGALRFYALFYRNASTTFCPPATANVTNGIRVVW